MTGQPRRAKGAGTIAFDAERGYRGQKTIAGEKLSTPFFNSYEEADAAVLALTARPATPKVKTGRKKHTFLDAFDEFIDSSDHADSTARSYRTSFQLHFSELLSKPVNDISTGDLNKVYKKLKRAGKSRQTVKQLHATARGALIAAMNEEWLKRNVADAVKLPKLPRAGRRQGFTPEESRRIKGAIKDTFYEARWLIALLYGLRPGEVRGLVWENVHIDAPDNDPTGEFQASIDIATQIQTIRGKGPTFLTELKTPRSNRTIYISRRLVSLVKEIRAEQFETLADVEPWEDHLGNRPNLVFRRPDGDPLDGDYDYDRWKEVTTLAGIKYRSMYSLRHTAATEMITPKEQGGLGFDLRTASVMLGHSSVDFTERQYTDIRDEIARSVGIAIDESDREVPRLFKD